MADDYYKNVYEFNKMQNMQLLKSSYVTYD